MTSISSLTSWIYLIAAIALEAAGTTLMKGCPRIVSLMSLLMLVCYALSLVFCILAAKTISISIVYALWCALGIFIIAIVGVVRFGEPISLPRTIFFVLIIIGAAGLVLSE